MPANIFWQLGSYTLGGSPNTTDYSSYDPTHLVPTHYITYATQRQLILYLNGVDQLTFQLYLDDPMAQTIQPLKTVVKVDRYVYSDDGLFTPLLSPSGSDPMFAGIVASTSMDGEANTMTVNVYSPFWRLKSHFHLLNHLLEVNPDTGQNYTQSELIWKLIDLINNAFSSSSFTGIAEGTFSWGLPDEPQPAPYFVQKGSNTWSNIFDDIMMRAATVDLIPRYTHTNADPTLMYLDTAEKRGSDISGSVAFNYHTNPTPGKVANLDNLTEDFIPVPGDSDGGFANYLWVVGQGGTNSGKVAVQSNPDSTGGSNGYGEIGVYMARIDRPEIKRLGGTGGVGKISEAEFAQRSIPLKTYTVAISPGAGIYYDVDYTLGDVIMLNATKGALNVSDVPQRIYQVQLDMSDNNIETVSPLISKDFYGTVEGT